MLGEPLKGILFFAFGLSGMALMFWRARRLAKQADLKEGDKRPMFIFVHWLSEVKHTRNDVYITYAALFCWAGGMFVFFAG
jgi:hypothetical protein